MISNSRFSPTAITSASCVASPQSLLRVAQCARSLLTEPRCTPLDCMPRTTVSRVPSRSTLSGARVGLGSRGRHPKRSNEGGVKVDHTHTPVIPFDTTWTNRTHRTPTGRPTPIARAN
jgi:hypothetical protein